MDGRASGGLSDAIRLRGEPDHACDEMLEVTMVAFRRALWRRRLRTLWSAGGAAAVRDSDWAERLRVEPRVLRQAAERRCFGELWAELEAASPRLARELVTGRDLKRELLRMRRIVEAVRSGADLDTVEPTRPRAVCAA
jgi:hypothetical protein